MKSPETIFFKIKLLWCFSKSHTRFLRISLIITKEIVISNDLNWHERIFSLTTHWQWCSNSKTAFHPSPRFHGVMVSTLDSESNDPSSNLGGTCIRSTNQLWGRERQAGSFSTCFIIVALPFEVYLNPWILIKLITNFNNYYYIQQSSGGQTRTKNRCSPR